MSSSQIRASKPKVRTGCRRCKARRVKCDETKPQCLRCIQYGRPCTGYDTHPGHPFPAIRADLRSKQLAPRTTPFSILVPLEQPSPTSLLGGQTEHQYFQYFRTTTVVQLSGGFEDEVWNRIVLQASHSVPAIQGLVISIGALSHSRSLSSSPSQEAISLEKYALDTYSQALKTLQLLAKTTSNSQNITRIILIASILIYVFESHHGSTAAAITYLKSALSIALNKPHTAPILYRHLGTNLLSRDIEDELITAFARLDGQLVNRHDNPDPTIPTVLGMRMDYYAEAYVVPSQFFDSQTARRYLEHIQYRSRPNVERTPLSESENLSGDGEMGGGRSEEVTLFKEETRRMVSVAEMQVLRRQQEQWMNAFEPLYEKIFLNPRDPSFIAVKILRFQGLQTWLLLHGPLRIRLEADVIEPEDGVLEGVCEEMLALAREVVEGEGFTGGFMFNYGLIPGLLVVLLSSPRTEIGWRAVRVLRCMKGRVEGTWGSEGVAKMGEGILMMQEMAERQRTSAE